jgi:gliding motility-associated-like protein
VESNSSWYTWTCEESGSLTFTLTALRENDDLDFALYELPNGAGNCSEMIELRCMLSGANTNESFEQFERCVVQTGLSLSDNDIGETCGCQPGDNGFVSAVNLVEGRAYGLLVNNFSPSGNGFSIEFGGTSTFTGPVADFVISPDSVECDRFVTVEDFSSFDGGNIISKTWVFGQDAEPPTATGDGPFEVFYPSIGERFVVLTVETDEGCIVTEIQSLVITECCEIDSDIAVGIINVMDPNCSDSTDGVISAAGSGGDPEYSFSIDGGPFVGSPNFFSLPSGEYTIGIIDIKGCESEIDTFLNGPPPLIVDAGPDQTVDLGFDANIAAALSPPGSIVDIAWTPDTLLSCNDCLNLTLTPPGQTTYTISVVDENGCMSIDEITIFVNTVRPVFIPNAFSPNGDGRNDFTAVFAGPAATIINSMQIFDRWGTLIWEGTNLPLNDFNVGWDGTFRGEDMNQGVFVYQASIGFIDGVDLLFKGDITLLR